MYDPKYFLNYTCYNKISKKSFLPHRAFDKIIQCEKINGFSFKKS
jgi:hypothetical protein